MECHIFILSRNIKGNNLAGVFSDPQITTHTSFGKWVVEVLFGYSLQLASPI